MANLIYSVIASLDGYVEDEAGNFDWATPDEDVHRTRIEREFDSEAVRELKATAHGDLTVGGPGLVAQAIDAGLVDELQLFLVPVLVGGGKRALPHNGARLDLELLDEYRFASGTVFLRYRIATAR